MSGYEEVSNPLMAVPDIQWLKPASPTEEVTQLIRRIQQKHFKPGPAKKETVEKFWKLIADDLRMYDKQLQNTTPFEKTCYGVCTDRCIKRWDKTYWEFKVAGLRKRNYVSEYKFPVKLMSVVLIFIAGVFRLIRANQDGKASFIANIIQVLTNSVVIFIYWLDGERIMLLPKIGAIVVSIAILYGILKHAGAETVGL